MSDRQVRNALIIWAALVALLIAGWKFAFEPNIFLRVAGNCVWAAAAIGFGRWFIWVARQESRMVCDVCEGKKHRK